MIQKLSGEVNVLPEMILIGITNTDRMRDLSPSHASIYPPFHDTLFLKTSGGAENFTAFIEKELFPYVDSLYPTAPYRILIGHSLGGLFVMNTLINHTKLFNAYISIDPSIDWDNLKLLKQAKTMLAGKDFEGISLFLAVANTTDKNLDTLKVKKDTTQITLPLRSNLELGRILEATRQNKLKYNWKYYHNDDHSSVPLIAEYDGLRFIFDFYNLTIYQSQYLDPSFNLDSLLTTHFNNVGQHIGYRVAPPESFVNMYAYSFMWMKQYDKALGLLKMNIDNFPNSSNVFNSMGDFLILTGDTTGAIENYEKSFKLNPRNENAKNTINKLKDRMFRTKPSVILKN